MYRNPHDSTGIGGITNRRRSARWLVGLALSIVVLLPSGALAECPLGNDGYMNVFYLPGTVIRVEIGSNQMATPGMATSMNYLYQFIGSAGCTTMKFGPVSRQPTVCNANRFYTPSLGGLWNAMIDVRWNANEPSDFTTGNGCTINCGGNICRVRGVDGLPVELMEFSVEGEEP